ncbi:MAG: adenosylhomocysteinase [Acidimicrobiales bacterium]|jgi:adenosylhomocysteinase
MGSRIEWVIESCRLLSGIGDEFDSTKPFADKCIGTGIHLEPKTVALLLTLRRGGAEVISTGNLGTTQPEAVEYLRANGVEVLGRPTTDAAEHDADLREVLAPEPDLILDNGGDLFVRYLESPYEHLLGGTEETTSGRTRLSSLRDQIHRPLLVINDSSIKQFAENFHAVGQSVLESLLRITNRGTHGKHVVVLGYGGCGKGVAVNFKNAFASVAVLDPDPLKRLEAHFDGFAVPDRSEALSQADVVITVTGSSDVVTADDLVLFADGVILANAGHFPAEIATSELRAHPSVKEIRNSTDGIETMTLDDGRRVHLLTGGHMVNLNGPRPLGNSIESMDLGFALQARCLEAVALSKLDASEVVVPVPRWIEEKVANSYLAGLSSQRQARR